MKSVLVTGAHGFIGKNLCLALRERKDIQLFSYDVETENNVLHDALDKVDIIVHLAGINRPKDTVEFEKGNVGFTEALISLLEQKKRKPTFVMTSSIQAQLDNAYGISKRRAEEALSRYASQTGASVYIFRLANVFGKWCRPFYNSVVATFCYQAAHGESFRIDDPAKVIDFVYIDDVVTSLTGIIDGIAPEKAGDFFTVQPLYSVSLGDLAATLQRFAAVRTTAILPNFSDDFEKKLYSTYLSYLEPENFIYDADKKTDARGYLFELIKTKCAGQIFISRTLPGITRGNHYHATKVEKFCVVQGRARIAFRHMIHSESHYFDVDGIECRIVDIPPGWTHSIKNIGDEDMITIFWANELFNPDSPDTYFAEV